MSNSKGFTLLEIIITLSILAILTAVATPSFLLWRNNYIFREAVSTLKTDLQYAKVQALKIKGNVVVNLNPGGSASQSQSYRIYTDNGSGGSSGNWTLDAGSGEKLLRESTLPGKTRIDLDAANTTFENARTAFNARGLPVNITDADKVTVFIPGENRSEAISVNLIGRIWSD